jgi:hypothetical protein
MTEEATIAAEDVKMMREAFGRVPKTFRGEIWEDDTEVPLVQDAASGGRPFDINTCQYWKPVLRVANMPTTRRIYITAANQIMKTLTCELIARHKIKHDPGHMVLYDMTIEASEDHGKTRFMPFIKSIPGIARVIDQVEAENRFNVTTTDIQLPGMILRLRPLNEASTQRISCRYIFIHDAFFHEKNGQIRRAFIRARAFEGQELIVVESQGGEEGDDFSELANKQSTNADLHVTCPLCGGKQKFALHAERADDFVGRPPKTEVSLDHDAWINHYTPLLLKEENRHAGFKRGPEELIKLPGGDYNEPAVMRETFYECYHCGGAWRDDGEFGPTRQALDASSEYVPTRTNVLPGHYGFRIPCWINSRVRWGTVMLQYLRAMQAKETHGNLLPLQEFETKWAANTWDPHRQRILRIQARAEYDLAEAKLGAWRLALIADNQQELMHQWVSVWAVNQDGSSRQLWRGVCRGLEEVRKKQLEYGVDEKGRPVLRDRWVFLDGRYKHGDIVKHIFKHKYGVWGTYQGERLWMGWKILHGSPRSDFSHRAMNDDRVRFPVSDEKEEWGRVDGAAASVVTHEFSATKCGDMAVRYRDGGGPETLFLPNRDDEPPGDDPISWDQQIRSHHLVEIKSPRHGLSDYVYQPIKKGAPDHYFHILRMFMAVHCIWGIDGGQRDAGPKV